uniref:Uncharacterized protein n=1 Tax=Oryza meridionalis TaxID=40149 RepID=A0A0E0ECU3_9ORYZ
MTRTLISLSSHASRGQRRSRTISVNMVIQLVLADDDSPTFALLTKLHLSETVITDDEGGYLSEVMSQGCPRLQILELVNIYSCVRELTIHTSSLLGKVFSAPRCSST